MVAVGRVGVLVGLDFEGPLITAQEQPISPFVNGTGWVGPALKGTSTGATGEPWLKNAALPSPRDYLSPLKSQKSKAKDMNIPRARAIRAHRASIGDMNQNHFDSMHAPMTRCKKKNTNHMAKNLNSQTETAHKVGDTGIS